ncbi:hypothetical protein F5Y14DRAFT_205244 [Nemania sp. NC0429]|nr:hypothetical protein F5Y14DRAFT_205244 [Nemania sp. NC0429]
MVCTVFISGTYPPTLRHTEPNLGLPTDIVEAVEREILWSNPRRQISKSRPYRRMYERRTAPYFYDLVALYVLQFGTFEPLARQLLQQHNQSWIIAPVTPLVFETDRDKSPVRKDLVVDPYKETMMNEPMRAPTNQPRIIDQLLFWNIHKRWPRPTQDDDRMDHEDLVTRVGLTKPLRHRPTPQRMREPHVQPPRGKRGSNSTVVIQKHATLSITPTYPPTVST